MAAAAWSSSSIRADEWIRRITIPTKRNGSEGQAARSSVMINGKRHVLRFGDRLVVPPGAYDTVGNRTAEVGHAIAALRPAMNIHQFFVECFEAKRTSKGLGRQWGFKGATPHPDTSARQWEASPRRGCREGWIRVLRILLPPTNI